MGGANLSTALDVAQDVVAGKVGSFVEVSRMALGFRLNAAKVFESGHWCYLELVVSSPLRRILPLRSCTASPPHLGQARLTLR